MRRLRTHTLCVAALLCHGCGGGGGGGSSAADPARVTTAPGYDAPMPAAATALSLQPSYSPDPLQSLYDTLRSQRTPSTRARVLVIDSDTGQDGQPLRHATNVLGVLRASSIEAAIDISYCDIRGTAFDNVHACLRYYRSSTRLPHVINYSRVLPREPYNLRVEDLPRDALMIIAAGQRGSGENTPNEASGALRDSGRVLIVSGENSDTDGLHTQAGASPCADSREHCLLAPYTRYTRSRRELAGTSFSAATVSGMAGTVRAYWPTLTATATVDLILSCISIPGSDNAHEYEAGRGLLSSLDASCIFAPHQLTLHGYHTGAHGLRGRLLSSGSFSLPTLTAYDKYGRDYVLRAAQSSPPGRSTFIEGMFDAAAQIYDRPSGYLARGLVESGGGALRWYNPGTHTRLYHHLYQSNGAETLLTGGMRPLGPARLLAGVTFERNAFAGGEIIGTQQLGIGDSIGGYAGLLLPAQHGRWKFDLQLGMMQARMLRPAPLSAVRALHARSSGLSLGAYWQPIQGLRLGLRGGCHSGLSGRLRIGANDLRLRARPTCNAELQLGLY